jgi:hypothetical protein
MMDSSGISGVMNAMGKKAVVPAVWARASERAPDRPASAKAATIRLTKTIGVIRVFPGVDILFNPPMAKGTLE